MQTLIRVIFYLHKFGPSVHVYLQINFRHFSLQFEAQMTCPLSTCVTCMTSIKCVSRSWSSCSAMSNGILCTGGPSSAMRLKMKTFIMLFYRAIIHPYRTHLSYGMPNAYQNHSHRISSHELIWTCPILALTAQRFTLLICVWKLNMNMDRLHRIVIT